MNLTTATNPSVPAPSTSNGPVCQVCGRQDDTLRLVNYPYVISLIFITLRRRFFGVYCARHRNVRWWAAIAISSFLGWLGIPFGIVYTPLALLRLARRDEPAAALNAALLRAVAERKLQQGDSPAARRCLEESLKLVDDAPTSEQLRRLSLMSSREDRPSPYPLIFLGLPMLLLAAALVGLAVGVLHYFAIDFIFSFFGDRISFIGLMLGWAPFLGLGILGVMLVSQLMEWILAKARILQPFLAQALAALCGLLYAYGIPTGRTLVDYGLYMRAGLIPSPSTLIPTTVAVFMRGGWLQIKTVLGWSGSFGFIFLTLLTVVGILGLIVLRTTAARHTRGMQRLANLSAATGQEPESTWAPTLAVLGLALLLMAGLFAAFPQKSSVDFIEANDHLYNGVDFENNNKPDAAVKEFQTALELNPALLRAHEELGRAYAATGKIEQGLAEVNQAIALDPRRAKTYTTLAQIYLSQPDLAQSEQALQKALELDSQNKSAISGLGWIAYQCKQPQSAEEFFQKALAIDPAWEDAISGLARLAEDRQDRDHAVQYYQKLLDLNPQSAEGHDGLGRIYFQTDNNIDQAILEFEKSIGIQPKNGQALLNLGLLYLDRGEFDNALDSTQKSEKLLPDIGLPHALLAMIYFQTDKLDLMQAELAKARGAALLDPTAIYIVAGLLERTRSVDEAQKVLTMGIEKYPQTFSFYSELATTQADQGKIDEANQTAAQAEKAGANSEIMHQIHGEIYFSTAQYEQARGEMAQAYQLNPKSSETYDTLILIDCLQGKFDAAMQAGKEAVLKDKYDAQASKNLALVYYESGDLAQASQVAQTAVKLSPNGDLAHFILGMSALKDGKTSDAKAELQKFLNLYWDRQYARKYKALAETAMASLK